MSEVQVILFQGTWIVSKITAIPEAEFGNPDCVLEYPCEIKGMEITPWPSWTGDSQIAVRSSDISVMVSPSLFISEKYTDYIEAENL